MVLTAGTTSSKARLIIKQRKLLKRCKPGNERAKVDVQDAQVRLLLCILLAPKAKLTVSSSKVQGDCVFKLQSFELRNKATDNDREAYDISFFLQKLRCSASCPSPEVDSLSKAASSLPVCKIGHWKIHRPSVAEAAGSLTAQSFPLLSRQHHPELKLVLPWKLGKMITDPM